MQSSLPQSQKLISLLLVQAGKDKFFLSGGSKSEV